MLISLSVKNLALIDGAELNLTKGLNILSGETGAGKSLIIGSLNLALGERADKEVIRNGADYALIELVFQDGSEAVRRAMEELELPWEEDGVIISRKIQESRSVFKVNGETVTARQVRQLAELLLDIHGQHEHQSLLHKKKHQEILDGYAQEKLEAVLPKLKAAYQKCCRLKKELEEANLDEESRKRELSLAEFEVKEIEEAALQPGEDEALEEAYQRMLHSRKIMESAVNAGRLLGGDENGGAEGQIGRALREISAVSHLDKALIPLEEQLSQLENLAHDLNRDFTYYMESLEFAEEDFERTQERLNRINHLKAKYGKTIEEVAAYRENRKKEYEKLSDFEAYHAGLEKEIEAARKEYLDFCAKASDIRKAAAKILEKELAQALLDLNFLHVDFEIRIKSGGEYESGNGYDDVEFMISTNPGEALRPLHMVASGGELSRIMLGLKTVLADKDSVGALIFDEIDAGISGKTAWKVSEKLGELSRRHQVLCITHLPQIAAMADTHFYIEKTAQEGITRTSVRLLTASERETEIARMLGGDGISEAALENARELIRRAKDIGMHENGK